MRKISILFIAILISINSNAQRQIRSLQKKCTSINSDKTQSKLRVRKLKSECDSYVQYYYKGNKLKLIEHTSNGLTIKVKSGITMFEIIRYSLLFMIMSFGSLMKKI